ATIWVRVGVSVRNRTQTVSQALPVGKPAVPHSRHQASPRDCNNRMTTKLLVIHPWVAAYRVPFYDRLEKVLAQHDVQLLVTRNGAPPSMAGRSDRSGGPWASNVPTSWLTFGEWETASRRIGSI